jgi:hypothetical protein
VPAQQTSLFDRPSELPPVSALVHAIEQRNSALFASGAFICTCCSGWIFNGDWFCLRCGVVPLGIGGWASIGGMPMLREHLPSVSLSDMQSWLRRTQPEMMRSFWGQPVEFHIGADGFAKPGVSA